MAKKKNRLLPLDRVAIAFILVLTLLIGILVAQSDAVRASVRNFSWQNQKIGANDTSFSLTFSRPMDIKSVESNLKIEPPLAGKFSWAGRRMVYTLLTPAPYGTSYKVKLEKALDKFVAKQGKKQTIQAFTGSFKTRDRIIVYIGTSGEELGRLVLYNLTQEQKTILTPKDLLVMDFKPYPKGDRILFSARARTTQDLLAGKIYSVTTGVPTQLDQEPEASSRVDLVLDNKIDGKTYQNLKFDLSPDGQTIVIQRGVKDEPGNFGLWFMPAPQGSESTKPQLTRIESPPGGDFLITPDSKAVAVVQGQGAAILTLQKDGSKPLDFLPQFGMVQAFSQDGTQAAMVKFNSDFSNPTQSLFLVTNQGVNKELLKISGSILSCQFDTASPNLYCLITQIVPGEQFIEQPYLVALDLKSGQQKPLLVLPAGQRNIQMNLAPDGLGILFDQIVSQESNIANPSNNVLKTSGGEAVASSSLWLMPLLPVADASVTAEIKPEQLSGLSGYYPRWLP
ncbi:Ig-like domain-containing protein [Calothrix sp. UHCC 0171]|uniref:Ig-like domain-containing protein n=1 Tax=Calothrix sp. UHCC 0171 TaxID=3110245 RepID=UPI002B1FD48A|nr:Ig-like domain-containing protein [Calothrix sp. UHCC 0171]MEA5570878.1 Ig-like domain-containing protein [Calothrix sp. UHCC 0171]